MENREGKLSQKSILALGQAGGIVPNQLVTFLNLPQAGDTEGIILDELQKDRIKILLNPRTVTLIALMEKDTGLTNTAICTGEQEVVYWGTDRDEVRLKQMKISQFAGGLTTFLDPESAVISQSITLSLNWDQLVVLMALADLSATNRMMALLEHIPKPIPLSLTGLQGIIAGAINRPDPRWLTTNILRYGHKGHPFDLEVGILGLMKMEILGKDTSGNLELRDKGQVLIPALAEPEVILGVKSYAFEKTRLIPISQLLVRTRRHLWSLDLTTDQAMLKTTTFNEAATALETLINRGDGIEGTISEAVQEKVIQDNAIKTEAKQHEAVQPSVVHDKAQKFCARCGHILEPGNKFCTRCGAPVGGGSAKKICLSCGESLGENAKFCLKCGRKVS